MINLKEKQRLKKFIKELEVIKGRHTELVSVYVPSGYELIKIIQHLQQEQGTAENIKDKTTRNNVIDSLERMIRHLRLFKRTPENGLAVFSGNKSEREGQQDIQVWSIEPPEPIKTRLYRCDQTFVLDLLREQLDVKEVYGLLVIDNREANLGFLRGTSITEVAKLESQVPGKIKAGGQCEIFGTLIQTASGEIIKIEDSHNPYVVKSANFDDFSLKDSNIIDKWFVNKNKTYKITTAYPQLINECSKDHLFYVSTSEGIIEKAAEDLKVGDYLLMPEKIDIKGKVHNFDSERYYNSFIINKEGRELLIEKRRGLKLLQRELGKNINLTQTTISYYEIGRLNPSRGELYKLCNYLGIDFIKFLKDYTKPKFYMNSEVKIPTQLNQQLTQFLGYFTGDGNFEEDRITFSEQNKQVALYYKKEFGKFFNLEVNYKFREKKNYHQLRFTSRPLVRFIMEEFPEIKDKNDPKIPSKILTSDKNVVAGFLRGLFDAEGYVTAGSIGIGMINKTVIGQVQLLLLRFSIISSFMEGNNRSNPYSKKPIFKLQINEKESIINFRKYINFSSEKKSERLKYLIGLKSSKSMVRQILPIGANIRSILEKNGYGLTDFPKVSDFFRGKRMMSKNAFKRSILKNIRNKGLYNKLVKIYNSNLLPVRINRIDITNKSIKMVDISVKASNFIANGLIVHNSAQRFARLREGAAHYFYTKIGEACNKEFLPLKNDLKGLLVGGPGPTKEIFLNGDYLNNELKKKIIGTKDLSYTGDFGLNELVDKSQEELAKEIIAKEKALMNRFFDMLNKEADKIAYGEKEVRKALEYGAVDTLLLSEALDDKLIDELSEIAEKSGAKVEIISVETREGVQLRDLTGIGAMLRFALPSS